LAQFTNQRLSSYLLRELGPLLPFLFIGLVWELPGWGYICLEIAGLALYFAVHEKGSFAAWLKSFQGLVYLILYHLIVGIHLSHDATQVSDLDVVLGVSLAVCVLGWLAKRLYRVDPGAHGHGCVVKATKVIMLLMIVNSLSIMALMSSMTVLADVTRGYGWSLLTLADAAFLLLGAFVATGRSDEDKSSERGN
jgi:hypothetical protein